MKNLELAVLILCSLLCLPLYSWDKNPTSDDISVNSYNTAFVEQNETSKLATIEADVKAAKEEIANAELASDIITETGTQEGSTENKINKQLDLNHYLKLAIQYRPDLKPDIEALKAARYELYDSEGTLVPQIEPAGSGYVKSKVNQGNKITEIQNKYAKYAALLDAFKKKWIPIVKEVQEAYEKLYIQLAVRKNLESSMHLAVQKRDMVKKQYDNEKKDISALNQAQKDLDNAQKPFIKAEKDVADARVKLCAACGISIDETKKPSIAVLNEAQQDYVEAQKAYVGNQIELLKSKASLNAAAGMQY